MHASLAAAFFLGIAILESPASPILGVEAFEGPRPFYDRSRVSTRALQPDDPVEPFTLLLSRSRYWAEDGHLEVVAMLAPPPDVALEATELVIQFLDAAGDSLYTATLDALPGLQLAFYPLIPEGFSGSATLAVTWHAGDQELAASTETVEVARAEPVARTGRIAIRLPNADGAVVRGLPQSVGIPFPRGALTDTARLRLVDETGGEMPAQFTEIGRWSKFGSLKWVRCDFAVDLEGEPRELSLEYGKGVSSSAVAAALRAASPPDQLAVGSWQWAVPVVGPIARSELANAAHRAGLQQEAAAPVPLSAVPAQAGASLENRPTAATPAVPAVDVSRRASMSVDFSLDSAPSIDTGRLRLDAIGLWADLDGDGAFVHILAFEALNGAFVEHEDGRMFRPDPATPFEIEESGPEKLVLRRQGWYVSAEAPQLAVGSEQLAEGTGHASPTPDSRFCQYDIRFVIHRDSPFVRVFHTWIFTGDSDRDRIRNMGWKLSLPDAARPGGFLSAFGEDGRWLDGDYLLQHQYNAFEVFAEGQATEPVGGRAPGVARMTLPGAEVYFGARDFWQAFPAELEFRDGALWFHHWPFHGKPRPDPLVDPDRATLLDFAHTGRVLDLRLPEAYTLDPLDRSHSHGREGSTIWLTGQPETINAQGLARTEEFWLYLAPSTETSANAVRVLDGIQSETLRAVVDPVWVVASGAFHEAHPQDPEQFGLFESIYAETGPLLDIERIERVGLYGMWLHGEALWDWGGWGKLDRLYRQLRKGHGGCWRLCWLPYARSGDPRLLKHHDAAMRRMLDANFCHYVSEAVAQKATGRGDIVRRPAFWSRGALPWAGRSLSVLDYERQPHQWWSAWHMIGYHRARDMAERYPELARAEARDAVFSGGNRGIESVQKAFVDSYENTFDPWFLPWMHALARQHRDAWPAGRWQEYGRYWMPGDREYHRFTGCPAHGAYFADLHPNHNYTWHITGDETVLRRRVAALMEMEETGTRVYGRQHRSSEWAMTLGVIARAAERPLPLHVPFPQRLRAFDEVGDEKVFRTPPVAFHKADGEALPLTLRLIRLQTYQRENDTRTWWIYGPDGREFMRGDLSIGTFANQPGIEVGIPADAPAGVYHLFCEMRSTHPESDRTSGYALRGLYYPVTPPGTPEVIVNPEERMGPAGFSVDTPGYYFHVPKSVSELRIQNVHSHTAASIRDADGAMVWHHPERGASNAELSIPPDQRGRLWRIRGGDFVMDPQVPAYYAVDADRWFDYSPHTTPEYPAD